MTQNQRIIFDELQLHGYNPATVYFKTTMCAGCGWYAQTKNNRVYFLGRRLSSALYNISWKLIKERSQQKPIYAN